MQKMINGQSTTLFPVAGGPVPIWGLSKKEKNNESAEDKALLEEINSVSGDGAITNDEIVASVASKTVSLDIF